MESLVTMTDDFWRSQRVLVTGHTGFKGSWLSLWLQRKGAEVTGYALPSSTSPSLFESARVAEGMHSVLGDVRSLGQLRNVVVQAQPAVVLHLAAQSLVRQSYADPVDTYSTNVMGTVNVLESVRHVDSVRVVVVVTSDKCYENREWPWGYRETDPLGGRDPYSSSKACAEIVTAAYRRSFFGSGPAIVSVRAGNVIGGGDWAAERLLPDLARAFTRGERARIRNPLATRPWQHVLEALRGYLSVAEQACRSPKTAGEAWNFGPDVRDVVAVQQVADQVSELWPSAPGWELDQGAHPHEARALTLDCSKARVDLGYEPRLPLRQALEWTVEWYRRFADNGDARRLVLEQIASYEDLCE